MSVKAVGKVGKKVLFNVKMVLEAGKASPGPKIGTVLGPKKVNMVEFCKIFNEKTKGMKVGVLTRLSLKVFADNTFEILIGATPTSVLLKEAAGIQSGAKISGKETVGQVKKKDIEEIAKIKLKERGIDEPGAVEGEMRCIIGTANSMGIKVVD